MLTKAYQMFACGARGCTEYSESEKSEIAALTDTTEDFLKKVRFSIFHNLFQIPDLLELYSI